MTHDPRFLLELAAQAIYDRKGMNILGLDISAVSTMTNFFLIAEGNVSRHTVAISESVRLALAEHGERPLSIEGRENGEWIVMDFGHFIIHIFGPGLREKYDLESLWKEGTVVDLKIQVPDSLPAGMGSV